MTTETKLLKSASRFNVGMLRLRHELDECQRLQRECEALRDEFRAMTAGRTKRIIKTKK